jgi:hypothetical protein
MFDIKIPFNFYHDGVTKTFYDKGTHALPDDAAEIAVREWWAVKLDKEEKKIPRKKEK